MATEALLCVLFPLRTALQGENQSPLYHPRGSRSSLIIMSTCSYVL